MNCSLYARFQMIFIGLIRENKKNILIAQNLGTEFHTVPKRKIYCGLVVILEKKKRKQILKLMWNSPQSPKE